MDWHDLDHINSNISLGDNGRQHMNEDWDCEMELSHYKTENAGRVSTIFMRHLRNKRKRYYYRSSLFLVQKLRLYHNHYYIEKLNRNYWN